MIDLYPYLKDRDIFVTEDGWISDRFFALPFATDSVRSLFGEFNLPEPTPGTYEVRRSITTTYAVKAISVGALAQPDLGAHIPARLATVTFRPIRVALADDDAVVLLGLDEPVLLSNRLWEIVSSSALGDPHIKNRLSPVYWVHRGELTGMAMPIRFEGSGELDLDAVLQFADE